MDILINAIVPIFLIVIFGFLLGRFKLVSTDVSGPLMQYVFFAAAPFVVFYALITNNIDKLLYWKFWVAYPVSLIIMIVITFIIFRYFLRRNAISSIIAGCCASMANTVIIGYPVLSGFVGHFAALPMSVTIIAFAVIFIPFLIFVCEVHNAGKGEEAAEFNKVLKLAIFGTLKNPIVIGVIVGIIFQLAHIPAPVVLKSFAKTIGESIVPVALFCVGLDLNSFKSDGKMTDVVVTSVLNLVFMPLIAIALAFAFNMDPKYAVAFVIFAAVPTAKTVYVITGKYQVYQKEVAAVISITTVFAVITIPAYCYAAKLLWPTVFGAA